MALSRTPIRREAMWWASSRSGVGVVEKRPRPGPSCGVGGGGGAVVNRLGGACEQLGPVCPGRRPVRQLQVVGGGAGVVAAVSGGQPGARRGLGQHRTVDGVGVFGGQLQVVVGRCGQGPGVVAQRGDGQFRLLQPRHLVRLVGDERGGPGDGEFGGDGVADGGFRSGEADQGGAEQVASFAGGAHGLAVGGDGGVRVVAVARQVAGDEQQVDFPVLRVGGVPGDGQRLCVFGVDRVAFVEVVQRRQAGGAQGEFDVVEGFARQPRPDAVAFEMVQSRVEVGERSAAVAVEHRHVAVKQVQAHSRVVAHRRVRRRVRVVSFRRPRLGGGRGKASGESTTMHLITPVSAGDLLRAGWRAPRRVGLIGCGAGTDLRHPEPFGLAMTAVSCGAELVAASTWTLPTMAALATLAGDTETPGAGTDAGVGAAPESRSAVTSAAGTRCWNSPSPWRKRSRIPTRSVTCWTGR